MKIVKLFIIVAMFAVWPAACSLDTDDPPSQTTPVSEIVLRAYHYPEEVQDYWPGGWESSLKDEKLLLSNLLPNGKIKNNTEYEVTIKGKLEFFPIPNDNPSGKKYEKMKTFQYVFTRPGQGFFDRWTDLTKPSESQEIAGGDFVIKGTLITNPDAVDYFTDSALAFTNADTVPEEDNFEDVARFTNVVITITEK